MEGEPRTPPIPSQIAPLHHDNSPLLSFGTLDGHLPYPLDPPSLRKGKMHEGKSCNGS
ncbi:hypothetical protein IE53DRAFT_390359 [Violaceomyces palustris]|uniref:Uncharacterized protein n=1 Tax=Violaceomyces palustris TaxID=1673888 RepID=A0ACD0NNX3_9BASI|nr:hypothetical protein IE53DRAFT_390359 [Violaceomyces palustris]